MRGCLKAVAVFGLVALLAGPALAQGGRGGMGGGMMGGGPAMLLGNPSVQKELKIDEAQKEKMTAVLATARTKMQEMNTELQDVPQEERMAKRTELSKPINESVMKTAGTVLKPEQLKRFHEIELQTRGLQAMTDPVITKKLSITTEQETKIKSMMSEMQTKSREIMQSAGDDRQAAMQETQTLRKETTTKVMALMTDDQKKTWKEMTGEPFEIVQQPRRGNN